MHYFTYKTTFLLTGHYYYGMHKTKNIEDGYLGSGLRLTRKIKKYGKAQFIREIIAYYSSNDELKMAEIQLITEEVLKDPMCLNLATGGLGGYGPGILGAKLGATRLQWLWENDPQWSSAMRTRWSEAAKLRPSENLTPENQDRGRVQAQTPEAKSKRIKTMQSINHQSGSTNSQFNTTCITNLETKKSKRIPTSELDIYLTQGWIKGANVGTCFVHHPDHSKAKLIQKDELAKWVGEGWLVGMKPRG